MMHCASQLPTPFEIISELQDMGFLCQEDSGRGLIVCAEFLPDSSGFGAEHIRNIGGFLARLANWQVAAGRESPEFRLWSRMSLGLRTLIARSIADSGGTVSNESLVAEIRRQINQGTLFDDACFAKITWSDRITELLKKGVSWLTQGERVRLGHLLLHAAFPDHIDDGIPIRGSAGGISFWLQKVCGIWLIGLWSGVKYRFNDCHLVCNLASNLLSGRCLPLGSMPSALPLWIVKAYDLQQVEEWRLVRGKGWSSWEEIPVDVEEDRLTFNDVLAALHPYLREIQYEGSGIVRVGLDACNAIFIFGDIPARRNLTSLIVDANEDSARCRLRLIQEISDRLDSTVFDEMGSKQSG
jgi:hypothetical protein